MLEIQSPVPLTEGETLIWGIRSKHVGHFFIGLLVSSPMIGVTAIILPLFHAAWWVSFMIGGSIGVLFATVPYNNRPIAEIFWLSVRYGMRPKVVIYDREYRVREHRRNTEERRRNR